MPKLADGESLLKRFAPEIFERWHFLMLNPEPMGQSMAQGLAKSEVRLAKDGSNIAEYLYEFLTLDKAAYGEFV